MEMLGVLAVCLAASSVDFTTDSISMKLRENETGVPVIEAIQWPDGQVIYEQEPSAVPLSAWWPKELLANPPEAAPCQWDRRDDEHFLRARVSKPLGNGLTAIWVFELFRPGTIIRLHLHLENTGDTDQPVAWYPAWKGNGRMPGARAVTSWRSLSFRPTTHTLEAEKSVEWHSRVHSSDEMDNGMNPYWMISGEKNTTYMALDWCGGWSATFSGDDGRFSFDVGLPPDETQLILKPGENVGGPALLIAPIRETGESAARAQWMAQREQYQKAVYGGPAPEFYFTYNNWYTTRFDINGDFFQAQFDAMDPYGFDAFIIDAGWYPHVGEWTPDPAKFKPGELEGILARVREKGLVAGVWSCPQFVKADPDNLPPEVDQPGMYRKFIDGWLLDYTAMDFSKFLVDHAHSLTEQFGMGWWKYDQDFFTEKTRAGRMKNVIAFQDAVWAVRRANPELIMENCQSGGRMTNEFTMLVTQSQWLRDGGNNGLEHARQNWSVALNSLAFVPPWAANRWTNNFQKLDPADLELIRYYCRSAMAGTWGIVSDLPAIPEAIREVILAEIKHYRRLNEFKSYRYDLYLPETNAPASGMVYYAPDSQSAAVLILRWDTQGAIEFPVAVRLPKEATYTIEDADTGSTTSTDGAALEKGWSVNLEEGRDSALLFITK